MPCGTGQIFISLSIGKVIEGPQQEGSFLPKDFAKITKKYRINCSLPIFLACLTKEYYVFLPAHDLCQVAKTGHL